jgi:hypothetical protein
MKAHTRHVAIATLVVAAILLFSAWYWVHYSMSAAHSFVVNGAGPRVLIATQGSEFKDAVVAGLIERLKTRDAHVKIIDVSELPATNLSDWSAVVVIHTWEMRKPPTPVKAFIDRVGHNQKLIVLTTSGAGDFKMPGVDAISSASKMVDVPARVADISAKLDAILATPVDAATSDQDRHPN